VLDAAEEPFDEVAMTVDCFAPLNVLASIGPRRDDDLGAHACDQVSQGLGVVGFVRRHAFGRHAAQQLWRLSDVVHLPLGKAALNQLADGIDHDVNLRRQSASGAPERLGAVFLGTGRMLMGSNEGGVDEDLVEPALVGQAGKDSMPHACARPARKPLVRAVPAPELLGQISPRATCACDPQNRLDKHPVVRAASARVARLAG
jgi:hypothetical protein